MCIRDRLDGKQHEHEPAGTAIGQASDHRPLRFHFDNVAFQPLDAADGQTARDAVAHDLLQGLGHIHGRLAVLALFRELVEKGLFSTLRRKNA